MSNPHNYNPPHSTQQSSTTRDPTKSVSSDSASYSVFSSSSTLLSVSGSDLFSSVASAIVSRTLISPLDVIKIRLQIVEKNWQVSALSEKCRFCALTWSIIQKEGISALWKGNLMGIYLSVPYIATQMIVTKAVKARTTQFWTPENAPNAPGRPHSHTHQQHQHPHKHQQYQHSTATPAALHHSKLISMLSGSVGGIAATGVSYPFDLLRTRFSAQQEPKVFRSSWEAAQFIWKYEGWKGFYVGLTPTMLGIVPNMALQFTFYDAAIDAFQSWHWLDPASAQFVSGFVSGTVAKFLTLPLDTIKKRFQVSSFDWETSKYSSHSHEQVLEQQQRFRRNLLDKSLSPHGAARRPRPLPFHLPVADHRPFQGIWDCAVGIVKEEGWTALWKGGVPSLLKAGPNAAIIFLTYEQCMLLFNPHRQNTSKSNF